MTSRTILVVALALGSLAPCAAEAARGPQPSADPWEGFNRRVFAFNEGVDRYALEPLATGYDWVVPHVVQQMVRNVELHTKEPAFLANDLLQGKPVAAAIDLARLVINSSVGFAGFVDVAKPLGLGRHDEDLGQTLGVWGVPAGPYLVLPLLGPSSPRDAVGRLGDSFANVWGYYAEWYVTVAVTSAELVNLRSLLLEEIRLNRAASFDFYSFVRNAYIQYREQQVRDGAPAPNGDPANGTAGAASDSGGDDDSLYYPADEQEDDDATPSE